MRSRRAHDRWSIFCPLRRSHNRFANYIKHPEIC
jgi:hypothetical protein